MLSERRCEAPGCGRTFFARTGTHRFCTPVCRERARVRLGGPAKYGYRHQAVRAQVAVLVASGAATCARCGKPIGAGELWDLDHRDDGAGYAGPAHQSCNRAAGADVANARRRDDPWPEGPPDEPIPDPAGGWWGPLVDGTRLRWSRIW